MLLSVTTGSERHHPGTLLRYRIQLAAQMCPAWEPGHVYIEKLCAHRVPEELVRVQILVGSVGLGKSPRVCISYKRPAGARAAGPWTTLRLAGSWVSESHPRLGIIALVCWVSL